MCLPAQGASVHLCTPEMTHYSSFTIQWNSLKQFLKVSICIHLSGAWGLSLRTCRILVCCVRSFTGVHGLYLWRVGLINCSETYGKLVLQPGIEPTSPALQSGFLTPGPPGNYRLRPPIKYYPFCGRNHARRGIFASHLCLPWFAYEWEKKVVEKMYKICP